MYKRFIVSLGIFLGSHAPAPAQTPAPRVVLAQGHVAPTITLLRTLSPSSLAPSLLVSQDLGKSPARFSVLIAGAYGIDPSLEHLSPMNEVKTLTLTQSSLPLVQLWGGRLQLDAFQSTLHIQNVQLGPFGDGGMLDSRRLRQTYPGGPRSVHLAGLSLSFHFGRGARTGRPNQAWRRISRIVGTVLN